MTYCCNLVVFGGGREKKGKKEGRGNTMFKKKWREGKGRKFTIVPREEEALFCPACLTIVLERKGEGKGVERVFFLPQSEGEEKGGKKG